MVEEFYGDEIDFFYNEKSVIIGARSFITSLGLSFGRQLEKIKKNNRLFSHMCKIAVPWSIRRIQCFNHEGVTPFLDSLNIDKIREESKSKVQLYKREFFEFVCESYECCKLIEKEDFYLQDIQGIRCMIRDAIITLGNDNAVVQIADTLNSLLNNDLLGETRIPLVERENSPRIAKIHDDQIGRIRKDILNVNNPILSMATQTASKQNEIARRKAESTGSQIETIAQKLREYEEHISDKKVKDKLRKDSLSLSRLAKSLF